MSVFSPQFTLIYVVSSLIIQIVLSNAVPLARNFTNQIIYFRRLQNKYLVSGIDCKYSEIHENTWNHFVLLYRVAFFQGQVAGPIITSHPDKALYLSGNCQLSISKEHYDVFFLPPNYYYVRQCIYC